MSQAEAELEFQLKVSGIEYEREFKFHPKRRWRADFLIKPKHLIEIEGVRGAGNHTGRHRSIKGFTDDCEKYAEAAALGYGVVRFTSKQVSDGFALSIIEKLIK